MTTRSVARPVRLLRTGIIVLLPLGLLAAIVCVWPLAAAAGFFGERTYLLVTQDPAELQPSGGYVGAYGAVVLRFARVVSLTFGDSKDLDDGANRQLDAASDSPDFPTAARAMLDVYGELTDTWPDGVIAIDPIAAGGLIDLVGPLRVEGEPQLVTRENLLGLVLKHTQNFDDPQVNRKQFVFDLGRELAARLRALPPTRWPEVVQALVRAADERHLQLYFEDSVLQRLVHSRDWDGAFPPPADDFLAVTDLNVGYNKANLVTDQALTYEVAIRADGTTTATLTVAYTNRGTGQLDFPTQGMPYVHEATYDGQVRVYVPLGSRRLPPSEEPDPEPELGRTTFEQEVTVPPESQRSIVFHYQLPNRTVAGQQLRYELVVRKQAGTTAVPFTLRVTGPDGWRADDGGGQQWTARASLVTDQRFKVAFTPGTRA